ncbi:MAG: hypothetical protein EOM78_04815, partial [Erysipelotrichia bacterium]|nr:hypothetical protein [Erysipelotrichia bacterium]
LEKNVDELKNHTQEDRSNISSMLGKIESILNRKVGDNNNAIAKNESLTIKEEEKKDDDKKEEPNILNSNSFENVLQQKEEEKKEESSSNKIDLNRMASLLNGFNH